jgi:hypothetical protein
MQTLPSRALLQGDGRRLLGFRETRSGFEVYQHDPGLLSELELDDFDAGRCRPSRDVRMRERKRSSDD